MKYNFDLDLNSRNSISAIVSRIKPDSVILEFGPANGRMTKYLKENLTCKVYTVEIDAEAAKDASRYSENIIVGNIEDYYWLSEYKNIMFDYIVFADVLEHLYYPEKVLNLSKTLLKDTGSILLSVPNIAHNVIIMELLEDEFTYHQVGLLDNTHIRFFTKKSLEQMVENVGLYIAYESAIYLAPLHTEFHKDYTDFSMQTIEILKNRKFGEVYQFICELQLKPVEKVSELEHYEEFKLYYDIGTGFSEEQVIFSSLKDHKIEFDLNHLCEKITQIRIDPTEQAVQLSIDSLQVNGIEFKSRVTHNGNDIKNGIKFLHHDPQLIVHFDEPIIAKEISLRLKFFDDVKNLQNEIINMKDQTISSLEEQCKVHEQQLQHKELEIQELMDYNEKLVEIADSMRIKNRIKNLFKLRKKE